MSGLQNVNMGAVQESGQTVVSGFRKAIMSVRPQTYLLIGFIIIMVILWSINYTQIYTHEVKINQIFNILTNIGTGITTLQNAINESITNNNNNVELTNNAVNVTETFIGGKKVDNIEPFNNEDVMESFVEFKPTKKTQSKK